MIALSMYEYIHIPVNAHAWLRLKSFIEVRLYEHMKSSKSFSSDPIFDMRGR
jgi:hypothetical protein